MGFIDKALQFGVDMKKKKYPGIFGKAYGWADKKKKNLRRKALEGVFGTKNENRLRNITSLLD